VKLSGLKILKLQKLVVNNLNCQIKKLKKIVVIADTGCRLKASENYYQDCNDESKWPLAKIMQKAAEKNPDLVLHIGDIHYRESPCPNDRPGCKDTAWGMDLMLGKQIFLYQLNHF
jgi:hypothetical protein